MTEGTFPPLEFSERSRIALRRAAALDPASRFAALAVEDPLELLPRIARRLRERAMLLELDDVHGAAVARVCIALVGPSDGAPAAERSDATVVEWLLVLVDESIDAVEQAFWRGEPSASETEGSTAHWLAEGLGLEPEEARRAMAEFNRLPAAPRRTFIDLVSGNIASDRSGVQLSLEQTQHVREVLATLLGGLPEVGAKKKSASNTREVDEPVEAPAEAQRDAYPRDLP